MTVELESVLCNHKELATCRNTSFRRMRTHAVEEMGGFFKCQAAHIFVVSSPCSIGSLACYWQVVHSLHTHILLHLVLLQSSVIFGVGAFRMFPSKCWSALLTRNQVMRGEGSPDQRREDRNNCDLCTSPESLFWAFRHIFLVVVFHFFIWVEFLGCIYRMCATMPPRYCTQLDEASRAAVYMISLPVCMHIMWSEVQSLAAWFMQVNY